MFIGFFYIYGMSDLSIMYNPSTFIKEVINDRYIQLQDTYGVSVKTIDYLSFSSAVTDGRFVNVIGITELVDVLQFSNSDNAITGMNNLLNVIGSLKNGTYNVDPVSTPTVDTEVIDYSVLYNSNNFIKEVINDFLQVQERLGTVKYSIDYNVISSTLIDNRFLVIYRTNDDKLSLQFSSIEESTLALNSLNDIVDQLKDGTYLYGSNPGDPDIEVIYDDQVTSVLYDPNTFIKEVVDDRYIQLQDTFSTVKETIDYSAISSAVTDGRFVNLIKHDKTLISLQFESSDKAITAMNKLLIVINDLKSGSYTPPSSIPNNPIDIQEVDYAVMYSSGNFIKEVVGSLIQIQERLGTVTHSINYINVTTTLLENRFLLIYSSVDPKITLQFLTVEEASLAQIVLRDVIDQLRDNTYNYGSNDLSGDVYDSDTFIYTIEIDDFSVQLVTTKNKMTHSIVAEQVISVYVVENLVKVKTEATDTMISLQFVDNADAIIGAEKLIIAIRRIIDRTIPPIPPGSTIKSFSKLFVDETDWLLDPDIDFDLSSAILQYYELICVDGTDTSCVTADMVKYECTGLVQFNGDDDTDTLDSVVIHFNVPVTGRATLISK